MAAEEVVEVRPGLMFWQVHDPAVKADLSAHALRTASGGVVLVDPVRLGSEAERVVADWGSVEAIVLTNGNHERAAEWARDRFSVPVLAGAGAGVAFIERELADGELLAGEIAVVTLPGNGPGEIALRLREMICLGDAVINCEPYGFSLLPPKYCSDSEEAHRSLRKLLQYEWEVLTFAHGTPVVASAWSRLESLIL